MKKKRFTRSMLTILVVAAMMLSCLTVVGAQEQKADEQTAFADALNNLGLFKGTGNGYELEGILNREQAIVMVVRMMGAEEEAVEKNYQHPFKDVPDWADPYIGYAYANWITSGISLDVFGAGQQVTEPQFITFQLRVLGYEDGVDFTWQDPYDLAKDVALIPADAVPMADGEAFTRGDAAELCWNTLNTETVEGELLYTDLVEKGVFTEEQMAASEIIVNPETLESSEPGEVIIEEIEESEEPEEEEKTDSDSSGSSSSGGSSSGGNSSGSSSSGGSSSGGSSSGSSSSGGSSSGGSSSGGSGSGGSGSGDSGSGSGGSGSGDSGSGSGGSDSGDSGSGSGGSDSGDSGSGSGGSDSGDSGSGSGGSDSGDSGSGSGGSGSGDSGSGSGGSGSADRNETEDIPL